MKVKKGQLGNLFLLSADVVIYKTEQMEENFQRHESNALEQGLIMGFFPFIDSQKKHELSGV